MSASVTGIAREPRLRALRYWLAERKLAVFGWILIFAIIVGALALWRLKVITPSPVAEPRTSFGTEGANLVERGALGPDMEVGAVGDDLTRTYIIRKVGSKGPQPTVIFLHGFGTSIVAGYEPWLEHLANEGVTVIFPSWQQPPFPTDGAQNPRSNMFRGVELATKAVPPIAGQVAAVGMSAGAALAFDYAALAAKLNVPKVGLVYSIYPGRAFPGQKVPILPVPPVGDMPTNTMVVTFVSRKDNEVGTRWGIEQYQQLASRPSQLRQLHFVKTSGLTGHFDPVKTDAKARRVFWKPLDTLLTTHLGAQLALDVPLRQSMRQSRHVKATLKADSIFRKKATEGSDATSAALATASANTNPPRN